VLENSLTPAFRYCDENGIEIPLSLYIRARKIGALKADGDLASVNADYHDAITETLINYFEGGSVTASRNAFRRAMVQAFGDAVDLGWQFGGGTLPIDDDLLAWFNARVEQEFGHIAVLFQQAKELRKEDDFDFLAWVNERADGYTRALREIWNTAALWAKQNIMATFDGNDGKESCPDCKRLKGKRHKVSWFINRNYVPPFGTGLECHPGRRCEHYLRADNGERLTV
jgi:hypothetical protein